MTTTTEPMHGYRAAHPGEYGVLHVGPTQGPGLNRWRQAEASERRMEEIEEIQEDDRQASRRAIATATVQKGP